MEEVASASLPGDKMDTTKSAEDMVDQNDPKTVAKFDSSNSSKDDDNCTSSTGFGRESEKSKNEVVDNGEEAETGIEEGSSAQLQPGKSSDASAEDPASETDDEEAGSDDCQFIESVSPSSKNSRMKQTRVHDWVQSPSQTSYKDKPSFKHNLPHWVDHFDSFFTFIKQGSDSGKNPKPFYVFQCKLCVGVARKKNKICRVRHIGNFLAHLKFHPKKYNKFATDNPRLVTKKKPKKSY